LNKIPNVPYTSPYTFTPKQRLSLFFLPRIVAFGLKAVERTCPYEVRNVSYWDEMMKATGGRALIAIWHETLGLAAWHYRNTGGHTLTSYSFDGEFAARVVRLFGMMAVRGSSSRGGAEALHGFVEAAKRVKILGFTLDGPRGPRRVAKPGIAVLAARIGLPIIPHAFTVNPAWHLNSWDRFTIPKPFARMVSAYGRPIDPPVDDTPEAVERTRLHVENDLNALQAQIEGNSEAAHDSQHGE